MTAEIAVMNMEAVALAADSAVTMRTPAGPKIYQSANKIFRLSRKAPVALMVYDSATFLGVPWETTAKAYRAERGNEDFDTLEDHAQDFLMFIRGSHLLFPADARTRCIEQTLWSLFVAILVEIDKAIELRLRSGPADEQEIARVASKVLKNCANYFAGSKKGRGAPTAEAMRRELAPVIKATRDAVFGRLGLTAADSKRLSTIAVNSMVKDRPMPVRAPNRAGVVIAGFGTKQIYPSVFHVVLEALVGNFLKGVNDECTSVGPSMEAVILPFAQREIVDAFLGGIDPGLVAYLNMHWDGVRKSLGTEIADAAGLTGKERAQVIAAADKRCTEVANEHATEMMRRIERDYAAPILDAVLMLPKGELGAMAESLVNLTSFRHKVSREAETVGGPIDVAVISRGDGLIWIKRKHYFEADLNPQYFATRFGGDDDV